MRVRHLVLAATALGGLTLVAPGAVAAPSASGQAHRAERVCARATGGLTAACSAWVRVDPRGKPSSSGTPSGYGPTDLRAAYGLAAAAASRGAGQTIAIVDAYDDPTAFADVNKYRSTFGIPALAACSPSTVNAATTACFAKSDQRGGTAYPRVDGG